MDRAIYCEILVNFVQSVKHLIGWMFQYDNDPKHTVAKMRQWLKAKKISFRFAKSVTWIKSCRKSIGV